MAEIFLPNWKNGNGSQFMKNLDRYLRYEVDLEKHQEAMHEQICRKENREMGVAKMDGLGQLKGTVPARDYFRWHQYRRGCWGDKQFINEYFRDNPAFRAERSSGAVVNGADLKK